MSSLEQSEKVRKFLADVATLSRQHGLSIAHEDGHGAFIVENFDEDNIEWLCGAFDCTKNKQ